MTSRTLTRIAAASLVGLMLVSLAFVPALVGLGATGIVATAGAPLSNGIALALAKIIGLSVLFVRVRRADVYAMQWSSMFILLFFAEGVVRAASDPPPFAGFGLVEAVFSAVYFAAVLAILRPLKRAARSGAA